MQTLGSDSADHTWCAALFLKCVNSYSFCDLAMVSSGAQKRKVKEICMGHSKTVPCQCIF